MHSRGNALELKVPPTLILLPTLAISLHLLPLLRHLLRDHFRKVLAPRTLPRDSRTPARLRVVPSAQLVFRKALELTRVQGNVYAARLALQRARFSGRCAENGRKNKNVTLVPRSSLSTGTVAPDTPLTS